MSDDGDGIVLPIHLSSEEAERTWEALKKKFGQPLAPPPFTPPPGDHDPGNWFQRVQHKMLEYRREETQQARSTRFFANEFMSLVPVGGEVAGALSKVAVIFAGGLSIGTVIELTKAVIEKFIEFHERETQLTEHTKAFSVELAKAAHDARDAWVSFYAAIGSEHRTAAFNTAQGRVLEGLKKQQDAQREMNRISKELAESGSKIEEVGLEAILLYGSAKRRALAEEYRKQLEIRKKAQEEMRANLGAPLSGASDAERKHANEKLLEEEKQETSKRLAARARITAEADARIHLLELDRAKYDAEELARFEGEVRKNEKDQLHRYDVEQEIGRGAALRAVALQGATLYATERTKILLEGEEQLTAVMEEQAKLLAAHEIGRARDLEEKLVAIRKVTAERVIQADFKAAKEAHDRELAQDLSAQEQENDLDADRIDRKRKMRFLSEAQWRTGIANQLEAAEKGYLAEQDILDRAHEDGLVSQEQYEQAKTETTQRYSKERSAILRKENVLEQGLVALGQSTLNSFANRVGSLFSGLATHAGAYGRALAALGRAHQVTASEAEGAVLAEVQAVVGGIAQEASVRAVMETGLGIATSWTNPPEAATHFAAAAVFGGIGGMAAAIGYGIGEARPMTAEERASLSSAAGAGATATGPESFGARGAGAQGGTTVVRETILLFAADPFETPQEAAKRAAQRFDLAKRLDLMRRES